MYSKKYLRDMSLEELQKEYDRVNSEIRAIDDVVYGGKGTSKTPYNQLCDKRYKLNLYKGDLYTEMVNKKKQLLPAEPTTTERKSVGYAKNLYAIRGVCL